jgi:hypothetical protein
MNEERKWFLEIECTTSADTMNIVEATTKGLVHHRKLVYKAAEAFERIDSNS